MVKGNTWLWASVERSRAARGSSTHTDQAGLGWGVAAHSTVTCGVQSIHPPLAGAPSPAETGICCFPGSKERLVQSGFGWEISKLCCSEPVSSLPPFIPRRWSTYPCLGHRAAQGWHEDSRSAQSCLLSALLAPGCSWALREGFVFLSLTLLASPHLWEDSREMRSCTLLSGRVVWHQGPGANSGIPPITFVSHWQVAGIPPSPKSVLETKVESVLILCCEQLER